MTTSPRLLIVDDNRAMRETLGEALSSRGFQTQTARDGVETLALVSCQPFDLLLLDMYMPRLSGLDTIRQLQRLGPAPACVLMSSAMDEELRRAAQQAHINAVLAKPFSLDQAASALLEALQSP